jgi:hypothetical protein
MERTRHVLIICYDFPGIYAAGVIRTYQIAKNLLHCGWQPVILTAQSCVNGEDNIETSDGTLDCPKITAAASRFLVPFQIDHRASRAAPGQLMPASNGRWRHLSRFATNLAVPDGKIGWLHAAVKRGLEIARHYSIRMCFSVSPRPTAHLVACRLTRHLDIPWVADFALPWSDAPWLADRPRFIEWFDRRVEGLVVGSARHITVAYPDLARSITARYGRAPDGTTVIPTGFNEDLFVEPSSPSPPKFTVVYPGNHFCEEGRQGEAFLKAVDEWINSEPSLEDKVEFVFIGKKDEDLLRHRAGMAHPKVIRVEPLTSHRACVQATLSSQMCIVNTVGNRIPAKIYECMRAGKWILALTTPGSDLAGIVNHYSKGMVVAARNTDAIRQSLQKIRRLWQAGTLESMQTDGFLSSYSAKHGAELVAAIFNRLLSKDELNKRQTQAI